MRRVLRSRRAPLFGHFQILLILGDFLVDLFGLFFDTILQPDWSHPVQGAEGGYLRVLTRWNTLARGTAGLPLALHDPQVIDGAFFFVRGIVSFKGPTFVFFCIF